MTKALHRHYSPTVGLEERPLYSGSGRETSHLMFYSGSGRETSLKGLIDPFEIYQAFVVVVSSSSETCASVSQEK